MYIHAAVKVYVIRIKAKNDVVQNTIRNFVQHSLFIKHNFHKNLMTSGLQPGFYLKRDQSNSSN